MVSFKKSSYGNGTVQFKVTGRKQEQWFCFLKIHTDQRSGGFESGVEKNSDSELKTVAEPGVFI